MTGICGWFESAGAGADTAVVEGAADELTAMAAAAGGDAAGRAVHALGLHGYAGVRGSVRDTPDATLHHAGDGIAVLLSEPVSIGDAAAVAAACRDDPDGFLDRIHGPFALAIAEPGRLTLAVDRAGVRPLYALEHAGRVWFASRLAALTAVPGFAPDIDDQALFDYLYFQMVPSPGTIYRRVRKLLPAERLVLGTGRLQSGFYWRMPYRDDNPAGFDALRGEFRALLPRVVGDAAGSDGAALGCFLSGGTDSSTVAGTLRALRGEPVPTYSMGFDADGFDEMEYARIAARHFQTRAREFYVTGDDVVDSVPRIAGFCDEPFGNASIVPAYLCARHAREDGITRMLAGDGGDEIFGGNERYASQWVFELYGRAPAAARAALRAGLRLPGVGRLGAGRKAQSYVSQARVPLPDRMQSYNFLHRTPLVEIFEPDFLDRVDTGAPLANLREVYGRTVSRAAVNRMMHLDLKITLADNDLRKVNQACALAGIDVRYPLLDDRMLAFAASVPPQMQLRRTRLRWFFKRALADFLPAEIIAKPKQGFGLPVGIWMAEHAPLRELTGDTIAAFRRRGIVRPAYIDWVQERHRSEHASYYGVMLWLLVMLEQWLQQHPG
jgi:asparagine synthase (glutamine-hydrolysing)